MLSQRTEIRAAGRGDAKLLATLCATVQELHGQQLPSVFKAVDLPALEDWFGDILASGRELLWICLVSGQPAGYVLVREQQRTENPFCYARRWYELDQIGVAAAYRRQGVAKALVAKVLASATAAGVKEIELNTWSFNEGALEAFRRLGFSGRSLRLGQVVQG